MAALDISAEATNVIAMKIILRLFIVLPSREKRNYVTPSNNAR
jgi:hypothetical protein